MSEEKKFTKLRQTKERRARVIERLVAQLSSGFKNKMETENGNRRNVQFDLTDPDKKRIEKELVTLRERI